jgi:hypothetical protein
MLAGRICRIAIYPGNLSDTARTAERGLNMPKFNVHFYIVTPDSAEFGDVDETGTIAEGLSLRDAIREVLSTRTNMVDGRSISDCGRWIEVNNGIEFETGEYETRTLHPCGSISKASYGRIVHLVKGV